MPQKSLFVFVAKSTKCHVADDSRSIGTYKVLNAGGMLRIEYVGQRVDCEKIIVRHVLLSNVNTMEYFSYLVTSPVRSSRTILVNDSIAYLTCLSSCEVVMIVDRL